MEERFSENNLDIIESMEQIVKATSVSSVPQAAFQSVSDLYSLDQDDLKAELRVFINVIKEKQKETGEELSRVTERVKVLTMEGGLTSALPSLVRLMQIFLTIPTSSASAERSFSCLRRLKNYLRSTMEQERLSALAILNSEQETPIDMDFVIHKFASKAPRKLKLL